MKRTLTLILLTLLALPSYARTSHTLHVVVTGDVHGNWFPRDFTGSGAKLPSLMAVKTAVDSIREAAGSDNVLLIDAGDCLQGSNASYYFNNISTQVPHLYPRLASYVGYDVCIVGNHDVEAGHQVYDRVRSELSSYGIPWLGGNAIKDDKSPYFPEYQVFDKAGLKVLVLGYTNANIDNWVSKEQSRGMSFVSILTRVQESLSSIIDKVSPQVVIVATHTGTGKGDGGQLENEGLDLLGALSGVDLLICAHDHRPYVQNGAHCSLVNSGARAKNIGHTVMEVETSGRRVKDKKVTSELIRIDGRQYDGQMEVLFRPEYEEVRDFSMRVVGKLEVPLKTRDAYVGMSDYVNLIHSVQLSVPEAELSLAAPLTFDGNVKSGPVSFNDMFTVYPYENQLSVVRLTGREILDILEYSYDNWICSEGGHVLRIMEKPDARTGTSSWSFVGRPYNFDSIAGLIYTVDVTASRGGRVKVVSLADGSPFSEDRYYAVAMTSYRANGGGGALPKAAGLNAEAVQKRTIAKYPEIRDLVAEYFERHVDIRPELIGDRSVLGQWRFVPEEIAVPALKRDMELIFPN